VGPNPDQFQSLIVRLAVEEHKVGPDVAIPVILPFVHQWVIPVTSLERPIGGQDAHDRNKVGIELLGVVRRSAFRLPL
jgi:hypothetical protein